MALPSGHDQYFTQLKTKYLTGMVSTTSGSVCTAGAAASSTGSYSLLATGGAAKLPCSATMEIKASDGTSYWIPLFTIGS